MIITEENRESVLLSQGATSSFIEALETLEEFGEIQYQIQNPEGAYYYLPSIENEYEILKGFDIVPICDGPNGDSFYVLLLRDEEARYVYFELEADEIYNDFGSSFQLLLAHIIIELQGFSESQTSEDLINIGRDMGLKKSKEIIRGVEGLGDEVDFKNWEENVLPTIVGVTLNK